MFEVKSTIHPMADLNTRLPINVSGSFYVDDSCIDCDQCRSTAPQFFTRDDESGFSYVHRQPQTPEDREIAEEALHGCPTESIGNDGPDHAPQNHALAVTSGD
jgi:ferredoxin